MRKLLGESHTIVEQCAELDGDNIGYIAGQVTEVKR